MEFEGVEWLVGLCCATVDCSASGLVCTRGARFAGWSVRVTYFETIEEPCCPGSRTFSRFRCERCSGRATAVGEIACARGHEHDSPL